MPETIFHAFNMRYSKIGELAPTLKNLGITCVQFPPVQAARELSEYDGELLRQQIKLLGSHLAHFHDLCVEAKRKSVMYPGNTFDHILKHRVYYINQPLLRAMYGYLLEGVKMEELLRHTYDRLHTINSPVVRAFLEINAGGGKNHHWHDLVVAADLVLAGVNPSTDFPADIESQIEDLKLKYKEIQSLVSHYKKTKQETPLEVLNQNSIIRKSMSTLFMQKHEADASVKLGKLLEKTKQIRNIILNANTTKLPAVGGIYKESVAQTIINRIFLYELIMYPPWWLIYQPLRLEIGNTFLGTGDEIRNAITSCKAQGLRVIVDIVVNNLAATAGERADWVPIARRASATARTLADIPDIAHAPVVVRLQNLLFSAFGTDDLELVTVPHACEQGREPTQCWMSQALPQLNQGHPAVQLAQQTFLASLLSAGVDGVRIDAAAHLTPTDCKRIIDTFCGGADISYIEYLGGSESWRAYPFSSYDQVVRLEDFEIGESLYKEVFGPHAELERTKNIGGLRRFPNPDSVVMLVNHDHVMGSIPSALYTDLPSQTSYELSLAYLIQRLYGNVLIMPHDLSSEFVLRAILLRAAMREAKIVREFVHVDGNLMMSYKFDATGTALFVSLFNLSNSEIPTIHSSIPPLSYKWIELDHRLPLDELCKIYNNQYDTWMQKCYISRIHRSKTLRSAYKSKKNATRKVRLVNGF